MKTLLEEIKKLPQATFQTMDRDYSIDGSCEKAKAIALIKKYEPTAERLEKAFKKVNKLSSIKLTCDNHWQEIIEELK